MAKIELKQVEKRFGEFQAVQPVDLTIDDGEFVVLLGPSGCGKTTTLRMISGLEAVSGGNIYIGDRDVTWRDPADRFQSAGDFEQAVIESQRRGWVEPLRRWMRGLRNRPA